MYDASTRNKPLMFDELPRNLHALHHSFGFELSRRNNLHLLDSNTVLFISGNAAQLVGALPPIARSSVSGAAPRVEASHF